MEENKAIVRSSNQRKTEAWITHHHIDTFTSWLWRRLIGDDTIEEQLAWLARGPSISVSTFQGYDVWWKCWEPLLVPVVNPL